MSLSFIFWCLTAIFLVSMVFMGLYLVIFMWDVGVYSERMDRFVRKFAVVCFLCIGSLVIGAGLEIYEINKRNEKYELQLKKIKEQS